MPPLIRLYLKSILIGFGLATGFVALLLAGDVMGLGHLVLSTRQGWLAGLMLFAANGLVFSGAQFAVAVLLMTDAEEDPPGGRPVRLPVTIPAQNSDRRLP